MASQHGTPHQALDLSQLVWLNLRPAIRNKFLAGGFVVMLRTFQPATGVNDPVAARSVPPPQLPPTLE
jgi:hypothetical protein